MKNTNPAWLTALQIAVILASVALSLFPQCRVRAVTAPFLALYIFTGVFTIRRDWASGLLSLTPGQLFERAKAGQRFPRDPLGVAASVAGLIAMWHINMG